MGVTDSVIATRRRARHLMRSSGDNARLRPSDSDQVLALRVVHNNGRIGLTDHELISRLLERDGDRGSKPPSHMRNGVCRYSDKYPVGICPWCRAIVGVTDLALKRQARDLGTHLTSSSEPPHESVHHIA